jgi:hypothetical protein
MPKCILKTAKLFLDRHKVYVWDGGADFLNLLNDSVPNKSASDLLWVYL